MSQTERKLQYRPGRFSYLFQKPFGERLWNYLSAEPQVQVMIEAVKDSQPALKPLLDTIECEYEEHLASKEYPEDDVSVFINNMIKQILEHHGYEHVGCGLCRGRFFRASGVYRPAVS
ncbi:MAG: hypothetical protein ACOCW1_04795 [Chitinispirillaceae bacterium]